MNNIKINGKNIEDSRFFYKLKSKIIFNLLNPHSFIYKAFKSGAKQSVIY